jgi:muramoyltetrapeptide carboxypeptidase
MTVKEGLVRVGVVFPSCNLTDVELKIASDIFIKDNIELVVISKSDSRYSPFRNGAKHLADELMELYADQTIDAIICARGGYGANQITPYIDWNLIKNNPKVFCGYSDITTLLNRINKETGQVTFHTPTLIDVIRGDIKEADFKELIALLRGCKDTGVKISIQADIVINGEVEGVLVGGNLAVICSDMATKNELDFEGNILFLEDVDEEIYRVERLLMQLKFAGVFDKVKAVILGSFSNLNRRSALSHGTIDDIIEKLDITIPLFRNFPAGHGEHKSALPIGSNVKISDGKVEYYL